MNFLILIFLLILTACSESSSEEDLCVNRKINNTCICYLVHDNNLSELVSVADCSKIELDYFPSPSQLQVHLNKLDLSYNIIKRLEQNNYVLSYEELRTLDLSHNQISYVNSDFFIDMSNLTILDLSYNNITSFETADVFANLKHLRKLDMSFNKLQVVEDLFAPLLNLRTLDLSYNEIHQSFVNTTKNLKDILFLNKGITDLRLDQLGIRSASHDFFAGLDNVKHLSLADNLLEDIPSMPLSLEYLDLSGNGISEITPKHMNYVFLKELKLDRLPKLKTIDRFSFYHLQELETLSISNSRKLKTFSVDAFGSLTPTFKVKLKKLVLSGNGFRTFHKNYTVLFEQLVLVDLNNNPWNCDCSLLWLKPFRSILHKSDNMRCASPSRLSNRELFQLVDSDLPDCYPEKYGKIHHRIIIPLLVALVIMLSMLVVYLIYYAPFNMGPVRTLAPNSPYIQAFTEDEQL